MLLGAMLPRIIINFASSALTFELRCLAFSMGVKCYYLQSVYQ